jgi:hypothetical protein
MHKISRRNLGLGLILLGATSTLATVTCAIAVENEPLAIRGYDPVAYFTDGRPVKGLGEIEFVWDEYRYRFSSLKHRELFKADPVRYAPQFENFCTMALTRGEIHEANPKYWLISEGRLYLFGEPIGPDRFKRDIPGNIEKANQNRLMIRKN